MLTVFLTGAGGAAVPGLIKHLKSKYGYRVLAADMDRYAAGLYLADKGFVIPPGSSPEFLHVIRNICREEKVKVFVPLVDEELLKSLELENEGIAVLLPRYVFVENCLDKFQLMRTLKSAGILVPETYLANKDLSKISFPIIIKPRTGRGSRGVGVVYSQSELSSFFEKSFYKPEDMIVQDYIDGLEFTVSVTVWRDGIVQAVVPKEIIYKKGITRLAVTRRNAKIDTLCHRVQNSLGADGPFNVQLRLNKETLEPMIFEINPRYSTTVSLTIAAGVDEIGALIMQAVGLGESQVQNDWRDGVVLLRHTLDEFVDDTNFNKSKINFCNLL